MFNLQAGIHLHKIIAVLIVKQKFECARVAVPYLFDCMNGLRPNFLTQFGRQERTWRFFKHLLMPPLAGAITLTQMYAVSKIIYQYLDLDMSSMLQVAFEVQSVIAESFTHLILSSCKNALELVCTFNQSNTASSSACGSFEHQWETNFFGGFNSLCQFAQNGSTREHWQAYLSHSFTRGHLVSHKRHHR